MSMCDGCIIYGRCNGCAEVDGRWEEDELFDEPDFDFDDPDYDDYPM